MLEYLDKDKNSEGVEIRNKSRKTKDEAVGSHIKLEKFGADLSNPVAEWRTEIEEVDFYAKCSAKMVHIGKDMKLE